MMWAVPDQPDMHDDERIESELKRRTRFAALHHAASCDSTQDLAAAAATDSARTSGDAVFWADHQRAGRGRQQREWRDEPGLDLAVTFLVTAELPRPQALPAALPVAVLQACEPFAGRRLRVKWPNDVYVDDRKLSGVLIDVDSRRPTAFRIGVGVNVNRQRFDGPLADIATSLSIVRGQPCKRADVLLALAERVDAMLAALERDDMADFEATFRDRLGLVGRHVEVEAADVQRGTLTAIDFDRLTLDGTRHIPLAIVKRMY